MIAKTNRFFYATALALVFSNVSCSDVSSIVEKKFGDSSFEITVKCSKDLDNVSKEKFILNTIENLIKEIDPTTAAKGYLEYLQSAFEKLKNNEVFKSIKDSKSIEESSLKINQFMQEWMKDLSKKENVLKQSVYFVALSDEAINEINMAMGMAIQSFMMELNTIAAEANKKAQEAIAEKAKEEDVEEVVSVEGISSEENAPNQIVVLSAEENEKLQLAFQERIDGFGDKMFDAIKDALSKHYTI